MNIDQGIKDFLVFSVRHSQIWPDQRVIRRGVPNYTVVGATCRPCGAKTPQIACPVSNCNIGVSSGKYE